MKTKLIATKQLKTLTLECGPNFFTGANIAHNIEKFIAEINALFNLRLNVLVYSRERLQHASFMNQHEHEDEGKITTLYQQLNAKHLPFNLALNGSPTRTTSTALNKTELKFIEKMVQSGIDTGTRNSITIADNALLPTLRKAFPELEIIASCISAVFEPNIIHFENKFKTLSTQDKFLTEYYSFLYSLYDKVVPLSQLSSFNFLSSLTTESSVLSKKTILFLNHFCGTRDLNDCSAHYNGIQPITKMPIIPKQFYATKENHFSGEGWRGCQHSYFSNGLINRPTDFSDILDLGINTFKIAARTTPSQQDFIVLCKTFATLQKEETCPSTCNISGNTPIEINLSFRQNYPKSVWFILNEYAWPKVYEENQYRYTSIDASRLHNQLHRKATEEFHNIG